MKTSPLLIVISAPSGAGKTTVCQNLLARHPEMTRAITCTTRQPRAGERHGIDYYFLSQAEFEQRVNNKEFLEHATVYGRSYGTLKSEVLGRLGQGRDVLLNIDVQGAATVCARAQEDPVMSRALVTIFIAPPSLQELQARLKGRASDSAAELEKRLAAVAGEVAKAKNFAYVIISGSMEEDLRRAEVIVEAERLRQERVTLPRYE